MATSQATNRSLSTAYTISKNPAVSLLIVACVVGLLHAAIWKAVYFLRGKNTPLLRSPEEMWLELGPVADYRLALYTDAILSHPCELPDEVTCEQPIHESFIVRQLRADENLISARDLLESRHFSSAMHALKYLAVNELHDDVKLLARAIADHGESFDHEVLLSFAAEWYLRPSLYQAERGRFLDAIENFYIYSDISLALASEDYWVSLDGFDITDIAVLNEYFCKDSTQRLPCSTGLLLVTAKIGMDQYYLQDEAFRLDRLYQALPKELKEEPLGRYIKAADFLANKQAHAAHLILRTPPRAMSEKKKSAWYYLAGRAAQAAYLEGDLRSLDTARRSFSAVLSCGEASVFYEPARRKLHALRIQ